MTIAACYVSPEGIVLGADSTTSAWVQPGGFHYFNNAQKLFEIGNDSTLGLVTWGISGLGNLSYRTLVALLADDLENNPVATVEEVAQRWGQSFWPSYQSVFAAELAECQALNGKQPYNPSAPVSPGMRSEQEETRFDNLRFGLIAGFCVAGYKEPDRAPSAYYLIFDPLAAQPTPVHVPAWNFWGAPNMIQRLILGTDESMKQKLLASGKWSGTSAELDTFLAGFALNHEVILPMREAIDFVYSCIFTTIKALKFSSLTQICGGPIELAVITSDRKFRWVRHKPWDAAITEGDPR